MKKVLKTLILLGLVDIFVGLYYFVCLILPKVSMYHSNDLTIYDMKEEVILQTHHHLAGEYYALKNMSPYLPVAFVAAEDQNFYQHYGYDVKGMARALYNTLFKGQTQGGSTITQQLSRTLFLSNEKSVSRKIQEAILTARIEMNYSKSEILEQYLNSIYLGHDLYGVGVASYYYFNKSCKDLSLDEAAMLAGIANAPALNDPFEHYEKATKRRNYVLKNMLSSKVISKDIYDTYINMETKVDNNTTIINPSYSFYQREIIKELQALNLYTKKNLAIGLNITVSFQPSVMNILEQIVKKYKPSTDTQMAAVILKPYTNQILAMAGSFDTNDEFNRAMMASRQIGSTIKPMIYYLGLDYGMTPTSQFISEETTFHIEGIGEYSPKNSTNSYPNKPITMIEALAVSDNIYATKTLLFLGSKNLVKFLKMFGQNYEQAFPSMALGVNDMTLMNLASIYNTFASEGKYYKPIFIRKVTDKLGNILYKSNNAGKQLLNPTTTLILNQLLRSPFDANAKGYATPTLLNYQPNTIFAAKTGSTSSDSYVVGFNPDYTIAIWVGKDDNTPLYESTLSRKIFVDLANQLSQLDNQTKWYNHGIFIDSIKVNPLTGKNDPNGSIYWFKN